MIIRGLNPERTARLEALVDECRPLLEENDGMVVVQQLLWERRVDVLDAVLVTRELLGASPTSLAEAKIIVLTSPSRGRELQRHEHLMDGIERSDSSEQQ